MTYLHGLSLTVSPLRDLFVFNKFVVLDRKEPRFPRGENELHAYTAITGELLDKKIARKRERERAAISILHFIITLPSLCLRVSYVYIKYNKKATIN